MGSYSVVVLDFETTGLSPDRRDRVIEVVEVPNHRLESLVLHKELATTGVFHRALADAEMTGHLWAGMIRDLKGRYRLRNVPFNLMLRLAKVARKSVPSFLENYALDHG